MHRLLGGVLIFIVGWGLGWYTHNHYGGDSIQMAQPLSPASVNNHMSAEHAATQAPQVSAQKDNLVTQLARNEFEAVVARYEILQTQPDDSEAANARAQILSYARQRIADHRFSVAERLLTLYLVSAYRDVEARVLLATVNRSQGDLSTTMDQLYEAKGHAYRLPVLAQITEQIRSVVLEMSASLRDKDDQKALLVLYQHLTQLEPDYAPYFMGLATTQLALDDRAAAWRSLQLVANDPDVGARARAMLAELSVARAELQAADPQVPVSEVVGIPLLRSGNHFIVNATPAHAQGIRLLIDTGASLTIFTPAVLEQHGIRYKDTGRTGIFNTANGQVRAPIYQIDALKVGDWQVSQLEVGVLELNGSSGIDGLLGMNFLRHFQFFIDQNEDLLRLSIN